MDKNDILNEIRQVMVDYEDDHPSVDNNDHAVIQNILQEINRNNEYGRSFRNIEDLSQYHIRGAGTIVAEYIGELKSQLVRACLLHHLMGNRTHRCLRVKNCKEIVWKLFENYLCSEEEFDSRIFHSYDNAFAVLKPKEYSMELVELSKDPCLFNVLPRTMGMLAAWQIPSFEEILVDYFSHPQRIREYLSNDSVPKKFRMNEITIRKEIDWWEHSGKYVVIAGLRHYPSSKTAVMLKQYAIDLEEEMKQMLLKCTDRYSKADVRYRYSDLLKTVQKSISQIESSL